MQGVAAVIRTEPSKSAIPVLLSAPPRAALIGTRENLREMSVETVQPGAKISPDGSAEDSGVVPVVSVVAEAGDVAEPIVAVTAEEMAGAHGMAWWANFWMVTYGTCTWPVHLVCTCCFFPNGLRWLGLCETPMRFSINRSELIVEREEGCTTVVPKPCCGDYFLKRYVFPASSVQRALVLRQDVLYEIIASSGGVGPDSGGGASVGAKDEGQPVEVHSPEDIKTLPSSCDILCEGPRSFPLWLYGCCYSTACMEPHRMQSMGTVGRHQCAYLAVRVSDERAENGRVALSRRAWRPGAVESLFKYRDALNDHLAARGE